jgi:hypothetical protein
MVQGSTLAITAGQGVLANDSDVESQPLAAAVQAQPAHGSLQLLSTGAFTYTPQASFVGRDEFAYRVSDGELHTVGRVAIDITAQPNQRPLAIGESFVIPEDSVLDTRLLESLLANDLDPEGQPLSLRVTMQPARGTLVTLPGGHITYTPPRDDVGSVNFEYVVNDGVLDSLPVQVAIQITALNDAPVAAGDAYNLPATGALEVNAGQGVLANDVDPDGDTLLVTVAQPPALGILNLALNGGFLYTRPTSPTGPITFRYRIRDPDGLESQADVTINVTAPTDVVFKNGFEGAP